MYGQGISCVISNATFEITHKNIKFRHYNITFCTRLSSEEVLDLRFHIYGLIQKRLVWFPQRKVQQAVPINGDNIPPLWSVPTPSRNTQQIVLFLSHCGSYTGENHSRKICLRRISAWLCPLECHGMEGIEAAVDTKSSGNVKKVFAKRFSVNFWPPEGQKWGHEHENR